jgi:hypothetical protein
MSLHRAVGRDQRQIIGLGKDKPLSRLFGKRPAPRLFAHRQPGVTLVEWMAVRAVRHESRFESAPAATLIELCMAETLVTNRTNKKRRW